jgi:hypothetical protein
MTTPDLQSPLDPDKIVSAQVVLAAAGGAHPGPQTRITSENIHAWLPSAETLARVSGELGGLGFELGACVGNSFSIAGPVRLFESCFRTKLLHSRGGVRFADGGEKLSANKIPAGLRAQLVAITFTPPPDFGPGSASFG